MAMANPERGEVDLSVKGPDGEITKNYVLKLHMNAAVALERRRGVGIGVLAGELEQVNFTTLRDFLFMLLQKHHKEEFKTTESVGELIDEIGGPLKALAIVNEVMKLNAPEGATNPQTAPAPIGEAPSLTPVA